LDSQKLIIRGTEYHYRLIVSNKAKHARLQASAEKGIQLIIPRGFPLKTAELFISSKKDWIDKHLNKLVPGHTKHMFLGNELEIKHDVIAVAKTYNAELNGNTLFITSPPGSNASLENLYDAWLKMKAYNYILGRVKELADKHGFKTGRITIRGQKTRWGSCSRTGNLSFNFRLMTHNTRIIDYVIIHELCHIKELNHSDKFWKLVLEIIPDYKALRQKLKSNPISQ